MSTSKLSPSKPRSTPIARKRSAKRKKLEGPPSRYPNDGTVNELPPGKSMRRASAPAKRQQTPWQRGLRAFAILGIAALLLLLLTSCATPVPPPTQVKAPKLPDLPAAIRNPPRPFPQFPSSK